LATDPGLFTDGGNRLDLTMLTGIASRISLNTVVDPESGGDSWRLRAGLGAAAPNDPGDSTQLQAFSAVLVESRPVAGAIFGTGNMRASEIAEAMMSHVGADAHVAEQRKTFATGAQKQMQQLEAEQGVDTDQELQHLMQIEQAYAANARLISVVDELMDTLLRL
jgi:flagellar hook-associated protein 1 FlgK